MVLFYRLLEIFFKLLLLLLIISFEKVIGYPVLFLTLSLAFLLTARSFSRYIIFILSAWMLTVFYQQMFVVSLVLFFTFYFGFKFFDQVVESNLQRFISFLLISLMILTFGANISINLLIIVYLFSSFILSILFLVKVLFVRYGFLGNRLTTKDSFLK